MIATVSRFLQEPERNQRRNVSPVIASLNRISKTYGNVQALKDVNLAIRAGELLALLGPNGAGKTTAVKLLLGLAKPTAGNVSVFGGNPVDAEFRMRTGAMLQVARVPETLRVREHIDLFSSYYLNPLPLSETLAICGNPDLLFLDEPTVGLDVEARRLLWDEMRKIIARGKTVLLTTHYLDEADALADRVVVINKGAVIVEGTPAEIKTRTAGKRIRCVSTLPLEVLRALPTVKEVRQDREAIEINAIEAESVLRELLNRDPGVSGIEVSSAGLEEAFLALTQEDNNHSKQNISGR